MGARVRGEGEEMSVCECGGVGVGGCGGVLVSCGFVWCVVVWWCGVAVCVCVGVRVRGEGEEMSVCGCGGVGVCGGVLVSCGFVVVVVELWCCGRGGVL